MCSDNKDKVKRKALYQLEVSKERKETEKLITEVWDEGFTDGTNYTANTSSRPRVHRREYR